MPLSRRELLGAGAGLALALESCGGSGRERPNVVFAFSDEHRWQSLSFTETPALRTPRLERLAAEGTQVNGCLSNYPVCRPFRAMLQTGQWPAQNGVLGNASVLETDANTLGRRFRAAGYTTGYIGKWHLGSRYVVPFGYDFSRVWRNTNNHWDCGYYDGPGPEDRVPLAGLYNAEAMTYQAIEYLEQGPQAPFFLVLSYNPPHPSYTDAPKEFLDLYPDEASLPLRGNLDASSFDESQWLDYRGYHAHISALDRELGRFLDALDRLGLADNTIVVYTSDHGTMLGSHGLWGKRLPHEESIRVPLLVRWPGRVPAGRELAGSFDSVDFLPTLLELTGLAAESALPGRSRAEALLGGAAESDDQLLMQCSTEKDNEDEPDVPLYRGIRTASHTLAVGEDGPWLFFDNRADPLQVENRVAAVPAATLDDLTERLRGLQSRAGDSFRV